MEFWARWAHRALWHASLWHMHEVMLMLSNSYLCFHENARKVQILINNWNNQVELFGKNFLSLLQSHHRPRDGPFELNDVFAITNAVPAISLLSYGIFNKGLVPGLCFGAVSLTIFPFSLKSFLVRYLTCYFFIIDWWRINYAPKYMTID